MKCLIILTTALFPLSSAVLAENHSGGDATKGEKSFNRCKACHRIVGGDGEVIRKGGPSGPNLYGVIGRTAGTLDGAKYSKSLIAAGEAGLVWTEENLAEYLKNPKSFLRAELDDSSASTNMNFRIKKDGEHVASYLATFSQVETAGETDTDLSEESDTSD